MNWEVFSTAGYVSVALWAAIPLLWLAHIAIRPRRWIAHLAVPLAIAALVLAIHNSREYVSAIQIDRSEEMRQQREAAEAKRQAALARYEEDAPEVSFAEDSDLDRYDLQGRDAANLTYFNSLYYESGEAVGDREREERDMAATADNSVEGRINADQRQPGADTGDRFEMEPEEQPLLMSESDYYLAGRLDRWNLKASRWSIVVALLFLAFDYVRRLNVYRDAYFPLPIPSAWSDALTSRPAVFTRPEKPRRSMQDELRMIARRGEVFIYLTDDQDAARQAAAPMPRLPTGHWPIEVLNVDMHPGFDDDFVFETLWYGRHSFVVDSPGRAAALLDRFVELLAERREARAHTRQALHIVWDLPGDVPEPVLKRFGLLGEATGTTLLINPQPAPPEATS